MPKPPKTAATLIECRDKPQWLEWLIVLVASLGTGVFAVLLSIAIEWSTR